jgi:serine/threonine protein kinase
MSGSTSSSNVVGVHYRVGKKIGEGSFGVIFEGTNLLNQQQVAIKFEPRKSDAPQLRDEYRTYKILVGCRELPPSFSSRPCCRGSTPSTAAMQPCIHSSVYFYYTRRLMDSTLLRLLNIDVMAFCAMMLLLVQTGGLTIAPRRAQHIAVYLNKLSTDMSQPESLMFITLAKKACIISWSLTCLVPVWRTCSTTVTGSSPSRPSSW